MNTPDTEVCEECEQYGEIRQGSVHKIKALNCRVNPLDPVFFDTNTPDTEGSPICAGKDRLLVHNGKVIQQPDTEWESFEKYLEHVCFEANPTVLDDDMPDFLDDWLGNQNGDDYIRLADEYTISRDTYWKERVLAILEDVLDREYQKRNPPKKHNYLESFMWDIHKAFMKDITNEDNLK